jgi:hypothetical protein
MTPIMLARLYGGRPGIAVQVVLATTLGSILTLPWIIYWGIQWVGLKPLLPPPPPPHLEATYETPQTSALASGCGRW